MLSINQNKLPAELTWLVGVITNAKLMVDKRSSQLLQEKLYYAAYKDDVTGLRRRFVDSQIHTDTDFA